jgi:hypothetical protein
MKTVWKIIKWLAVGVGTIILLVVLALVLFTGPIAKYVIEHKSEQYTGRVILLDKLKINVFNGKVNAFGLRVYETDKKTLFFSSRHLFVKLDEGKLLKSVYRIEHLYLEDPSIRIIQKGYSFNYDDILKKFEPDPKAPKNPADTILTKYFLEDVKIKGGKVSYNYQDYQLNTQFMKLGIVVPKFSWNDPSVVVHYDFIIRSGGMFNGDLQLNLNTLEFTHSFTIDGFNLDILYPYLKPYLKIKSFKGQLSMTLLTKGNFNDPQAIAMKGKSGIYKVVITDEKGEKVAGFNMFTQTIDSLNVKKNLWNFGPILLDEPYIRYERFPDTDNLSELIITSMTTQTSSGNAPTEAQGNAKKFNPFVILANYISDLAKEIIITDYKVKRFSITGGSTDFYDHTLDEEFHLNLSEMYFDVQQLNSLENRANIDFSTSINKGGFMRADISVNPKDFMDFYLKYELKNVAVIDYNPYSIFHVAYPFTKGKFNYTGAVTVKNHKIKMDNNVFIEKIYAGKKIQTKTAMHLPIKLVLAILRDKKGNITLSIPVEGDLDNPKFSWWKAAVQVLKNLFSKAISAPGNLLASITGHNEDELKEIQFDSGQDRLTEKQMSHLKKLADMLNDKPELTMELKQTIDLPSDLENLTYFEARKKYYSETRNKQFQGDSIPQADLLAINTLSVTDTAFLSYLNKKLGIKDPLVSTLEKCTRLLGADNLKKLQQAKLDQRNSSLSSYLTSKLSLPANRFSVINNSDPKQVPDDKIPRYLITYTTPE